MAMGLRIHEEDELRGIDIAAHSEFAYLTDADPVNLGASPRS
jgi:Amt family ammonium transporter